MSFGEFVKSQFIDVIEHIDTNDELIVYKYERYKDEIKTGASLIVREGQMAVFVYKGVIADIFSAGSYNLDTKNLPVLSSLRALPRLFNSPIKSDLYFINISQKIGNRWGTKNPMIKRDKDLGMVRLTSFGTYSFSVSDPKSFIQEILGARKLYMTYDIIQFLCSIINESLATVLSETNTPVLDIISDYSNISKELTGSANQKIQKLGVTFKNIIVENIGLPAEVEKAIDEQSGLGLVSNDMDTYMKYQTIKAMRDASKQDGGLAGLGAGMALGNQIVNTVSESNNIDKNSSNVEKLREYKSLLDEGILTQEEFEKLKKNLLKL